jgi:hypothetical protein
LILSCFYAFVNTENKQQLILKAEATATVDFIGETPSPLGTPTIGFIDQTEEAQTQTALSVTESVH